MRRLQPPGWPAPRGYANGIEASGRLVFVGGQIGWDASGAFAVRAGRAGAPDAVEHRRGARGGRRRARARRAADLVRRRPRGLPGAPEGDRRRLSLGHGPPLPGDGGRAGGGAGRGARRWSRSRPRPSCPEPSSHAPSCCRPMSDTVGDVWRRVGSRPSRCSRSLPRSRRSRRRATTRRPSPSIRVQPAAPRAGTTVVLTATSPGSGLTHAWDLDGDGAFDDAAGAQGHDDRGGLRKRRRPLDRRRRPGRQRAADARGPRRERAADGAAAARLARPRCRDDDRGRRRRVGPGRPRRDDRVRHPRRRRVRRDGGLRARSGRARRVRAITTRSLGPHSTRVRITDDAGATTVLRTDLFVHLENLPPRVAIDVTPADPEPGEPVTVSARASDPDGPPPGLAFDLDGDGTYETDAGGGSSVRDDASPPLASTRSASAPATRTSPSAARPSSSGLAPLVLTLPDGPVRPGVAATYRASEAGDVGARRDRRDPLARVRLAGHLRDPRACERRPGGDAHGHRRGRHAGSRPR